MITCYKLITLCYQVTAYYQLITLCYQILCSLITECYLKTCNHIFFLKNSHTPDQVPVNNDDFATL
jgi:hypothetical protein